VADRCQSAISPIHDYARTAAEHNLVVSDGEAWSARRCGRNRNRHHDRSG
jgi:hypothetical protein